VEALEERTVPTVTFLPQYGPEGVVDNGGLKLNDVPVYLIFEGRYWQDGHSDPNGTTPTAGEVTADIQKILGGPYLKTVTQYGANGLAHLAANPLFVNDNLPSGQFDGGRLADIVDSLQDDAGALPEYDDLPRIPLYVVVTPPNVMSSNAGAASFNGMQYDSDFPYTDVDKIPLIWLGGVQPNGIPANGTIRDWYSDNFSHELAEAITDISKDGIRVSAPPAFVKQFGSGATGQEIGDNEAAFRTYRVNGVLVQSLWSQGDGAYDVADGTSQVFYVSYVTDVGNVLTVNGDQHPGAPNDTITVGMAQSGPSQGGVWVTLDGETVQFEQGQLNQVQINTGSGQDVVNVEGLPAGVSLFVNKGGSGTGVVNVSPLAGNLNNIQGRVDVSASNLAALTVNAYDRNDPNAVNYRVGPATITWGGPGSITYYGGMPANLALYAGRGANAIRLGDLGLSLDHFHTVTLDGGGNSALTVYDQQASASETYTLAADHLLRGLGQQQVRVNYAHLQSLTLDTAWFASTVTIDGTPAPTTVVGGGHADRFNVAPTSHNLDWLRGSGLTLDGGTGGATVVLDDTGHNNPYDFLLTYSVTANNVQRTEGYTAWINGQQFPQVATVPVNYAHLNQLVLYASTWFPPLINVESTSAATDIHGGSQVVVTPTSQTLNSINGVLSIYGGNLTVDDLANPYGRGTGATVSYSVGSGSMSQSVGFPGKPPQVAAVIQYTGLSGLTLDTSIASNKVLVGGTPAPTTINCGAADAVTVGDFLGTVGSVTVNGHGGTLTLDDSVTSNSDGPVGGFDGTISFTVAFSVTDQSVGYHAHEVDHYYYEPPDGGKGKWVTVTENFASAVHYSNVSALTINGGQADNSFVVQSTPAGTPLTINGSTGQRVKTGDPTVNQFTVGSGTVKTIRSPLTLNGSGPADTLLVDDSSATTQDVVTVTGTQVGTAALDHFFGAGGGLTYNGISALTLNLSAAYDDKVHLTPGAVTALLLNGNHAAWQAGHGASFDLDPADVAYATDHPTGLGSGYLTFSNGKKSVTYSDFARH
jgi:hypothetical protein